MDKSLIAQAISYHGQPLQKIWEGERGDDELHTLGFVHPDFSVYQTRQKHLSIQDRTKRLKIHQFIAKKANFLFGIHFSHSNDVLKSGETYPDNSFAVVPPYEMFFNSKMDKVGRTKHFFEQIKVGDIVFGSMISKSGAGSIVKVLCTAEPNVRYVNDLTIKSFLPNAGSIPSVDRKGNPRPYTNNDLLCCEVTEVVPDAEKMVLTMKGAKRLGNELSPPLGLVHKDSLPEAYKLAVDWEGKSYDRFLEDSPGFRNPSCIDTLSQCVGLESKEVFTNMSSLHGRFPQHEYANELRQVQASKWAFRSVAEGIEHFKQDRHSEAFQCLNKALNIDPRNVEGLVARGALYANSGSFKKAVEDFETALKLHPSHANARKYMGETLVALGRSYEEENKVEDAKKAYQECLAIIPHHEQATTSLEFLRGKNTRQPLIEPNELTLPGNLLNLSDVKRGDNDRKDKKPKKKKSKNRKRKTSSSSSSSDSSDSSDTSSESSSTSESSSSSGSDQSKTKRKKRNKEPPLSPLSRRALMEFGGGAAGGGSADRHFPYNQQPFGTNEAPADDYETKVRKFLAITRDVDNNYEEKVRRLVEETARYNERKNVDDKTKKRDKKKSKKSKKDSKKKRKDKKSKSGRREKDDVGEMEFKEALRIIKNLPGFNQLEEQKRHKLDTKPEGEKWKMSFQKDERKRGLAEASTTKPIPRQYAFSNDDDSDNDRNFFGAPAKGSHAKSPEKVVIRPAPAQQSTNSAASSSRHPRFQEPPPNARAAPPQIGAVVLDKFGNFRLASNDKKPPEPQIAGSHQQTVPTRVSRSRSRNRYNSRSRSRSRSQRRRSRSRSYGRRYSRSRSRTNRSRSRSRSYSRSRSRSVSVERRRGGRGRGRGNSFMERGTYYKPRPWGGRGRGNFDFRGRGRDRPYHHRGGRNGGDRGARRGFHDYRYNNRYSRSRSMSDDRGRSPINDRERDKNNSDSDQDRKERLDRRVDRNAKRSPSAKSLPPPKDGKIDANASLEDMEKFIDKAKKEHKEDMLERNKDLVKKPAVQA